jgi:hypothetical protein
MKHGVKDDHEQFRRVGGCGGPSSLPNVDPAVWIFSDDTLRCHLMNLSLRQHQNLSRCLAQREETRWLPKGERSRLTGLTLEVIPIL